MRISSRAGNFNMTIEEVTVENGELVMTGKMGVWSAKTMLSVEELRQMLQSMKISAKVLDFAVLFAFRHIVGVVEEDRARTRALEGNGGAAIAADKP